ncbi:MAG: hypothetical protein HZC47_06380 [Methanobacterium sp.]|uniref:putative glycoside hydrolase n=1 Tax=Methanobacterium sp. TaxID=2164 RepID=UPI003D654914|nr:hypothetical protein [Methanobacterium sp.]
MAIAIFLAFMMIAGTSGAFAVEGDGTTQSDGSTDPGSAGTSESGSTGTCSTDTGSTGTCSTDTCSTDTPEVSTAPAAAGDVSTNAIVIRGIYIWASQLSTINPADIASKYTDVYFLTRSTSGANYVPELIAAMNALHPLNVRVHAWMVCFKNGGSFVNPSGFYSYTVPVYLYSTKRWGKKLVAYKVKKRGKYIIKYRYKKGWIYTPVYGYNTVTGYDTSYTDTLVNYIGDVSTVKDGMGNYVDGIHLDYVRYSGVGANAAYNQPGGAIAARDTITNFVKRVHDKVRPTAWLTAAVMPETSNNEFYYGQCYSAMGQYLNYEVPMIYKGNYGQSTAWIQATTQWIATHSGGTPIIAGLQTYRSDSQPTPIPYSELLNDVWKSQDGGALGFAFFRYGLLNWNGYVNP